jgi:murein DD-endopeptidase MepM/ murein hydrolase activator NlpD
MKNRIQLVLTVITLGIATFSFIKKANKVPNISPINESELLKVASGFGMRTHPVTKTKKMHKGVDYVLEKGSVVMATADGKVILVEHLKTGRGNNITIQHANNITTSYCHLEEVKVALNQMVSQKDIIGTVGSTGYATGPHLHYEIEVDGVNVNPISYILK